MFLLFPSHQCTLGIVHGRGAAYAARYAVSQRIEAEERAHQLARSLTAGAAYSVLYAASERLEAEARLSRLASGSNVGAIAASM